MTTDNSKNILWWGRFDPDYSRNRILRTLLLESGYSLHDFIPRVSALGGLESFFARLTRPDAVWVPAFRQRDFHAASRFAIKHGVPLIFDPMISAWDKVVFERKKYPATSRQARKILRWEQSMFSQADLVIADTRPHARFFIEALSATKENTCVVPVGAEESLFTAQPILAPGTPPEIFFFGSYINLQGPEVIIEAATMVPEARWTLLGNGSLRKVCEKKAAGHSHIHFEEWLQYEKLPERIGQADILLGIFGASPKSGRVIPNKVYQALACGRPLITRESAAYPEKLAKNMADGINFIPAADPKSLAAAVRSALSSPERFAAWGQKARQTYEIWFSERHIKQALTTALTGIGL